MALSAKVSEGGLLVLEALPDSAGKTNMLAKILAVLDLPAKTLIVAGGDQERLRRAAANVPGVTVVDPERVNVRDLLRHDAVLVARRDVARLQEVWA